MTKTVFLTHSAVASGAELALTRALAAWPADDEVLVIIGESGEISRRLEEAGIPVRVVPISSTSSAAGRANGLVARVKSAVGLLGYGLRLRHILKEEKPDVVVGRSLRAAMYGRVATLGTAVPFVWSIHDLLSSEYLGRPASIIYARVLPRLMSGIIVNSRTTAATVRFGRRPVLVIPPSLSKDGRDRDKTDAGLAKIVVLGRLAHWKGQDVAIRAFARVAKDHHSEMSIVGDALFGELEFAAELRKLIEDLCLSSKVRLVGHVDDPRKVLLGTNVLIHSSRLPEPFGAVVTEGLDAGCIVVATHPGGPAETITHGVTGWLARAGDEDDLTRQLGAALAMSVADRDRMVAAGRVVAKRHYADKLSPVLARWLHDVAARTAHGFVDALEEGARGD